MTTWSRRFSKCVQCSSTKFRHMAGGLCSSCYAMNYKKDPTVKARIEKQKAKWYQKFHEENLLKRKLYREQKWFSGKRSAVLKRDSNKCITCGTQNDLVVHHKDHNGRGAHIQNNDMSNLVTLCRTHHLLAHVEELHAWRKRKI